MDNYVEIVRELNSDLYDIHGESEKCFFYKSTGFTEMIYFGDVLLYSDDMDDREWDETTGLFKESLISHIKTLYNKWVDSLVKLKFKTPRKYDLCNLSNWSNVIHY